MSLRHRLEWKKLARKIFKEINQCLTYAGVLLKEGTLVDATIIEASTSTDNEMGERDTEMHQAKKCNQRHFGMKAHISVDARAGITHNFTTTPAHEHDLNQAGLLPIWR
ncbi:MAG: transposase [Oceanospirillaceae bacterium]|nr:transposase [Oceanospirillaceae bacterium]